MDAVRWSSWKFSEVMYVKGDMLSFIFGAISLTPLLAIVSLVVQAVTRLDKQLMAVLWLLFFNEILNLVLKYAIRQPRPILEWDNSDVGFGMPSRHAQTSFALATAITLFFPKMCDAGNRPKTKRLYSSPWRPLFLFALATLVSAGRVYNQYHSAEQVIAGAITGVAAAIILQKSRLPHNLADISYPLARLILHIL